jgi:hypothetical protein
MPRTASSENLARSSDRRNCDGLHDLRSIPRKQLAQAPQPPNISTNPAEENCANEGLSGRPFLQQVTWHASRHRAPARTTDLR